MSMNGDDKSDTETVLGALKWGVFLFGCMIISFSVCRRYFPKMQRILEPRLYLARKFTKYVRQERNRVERIPMDEDRLIGDETYEESITSDESSSIRAGMNNEEQKDVGGDGDGKQEEKQRSEEDTRRSEQSDRASQKERDKKEKFLRKLRKIGGLRNVMLPPVLQRRGATIFHWIFFVWTVSDESLLKYTGFGGFMFLKLIYCHLRSYLFCTPFALSILIPLYVSGGSQRMNYVSNHNNNNNNNYKSRDDLIKYFQLSNVESDDTMRLSVATILFIFFMYESLQFLIAEYRKIEAWNDSFLTVPIISNYSCLIKNIPSSHIGDRDKLLQFLNVLFEDKVEEIVLVPKSNLLNTKYLLYKKLSKLIDKCHKYQNDDNDRNHELFIDEKLYLFGCITKRHYLNDLIEKRNKCIQEMIDLYHNLDYTTNAFIKMNNLTSTNTAANTSISVRSDYFQIKRAPFQNDINWKNISSNSSFLFNIDFGRKNNQTINNILALIFFLLTLGIFCFLVWQSHLIERKMIENNNNNNSNNHSKSSSSFNWNHKYLFGLSRFIGPFLVNICVLLMPFMLDFISFQIKKFSSNGSAHEWIFTQYYNSIIFVVLPLLSITMTIWNLQNDTNNSHEIDIQTLISKFSQEFENKSGFYIAYLLNVCFFSMPLQMWMPLGNSIFKSVFLDWSFWKRGIIHTRYDSQFPYSKWYATLLLFNVIVLTYAVVSPLCFCIGSLLCALCYTFFTHLLLCSYLPNAGSRMSIFQKLVAYTMRGYILSICIFISILAMKKAWLQCLILIIFTVLMVEQFSDLQKSLDSTAHSTALMTTRSLDIGNQVNPIQSGAMKKTTELFLGKSHTNEPSFRDQYTRECVKFVRDELLKNNNHSDDNYDGSGHNRGESERDSQEYDSVLSSSIQAGGTFTTKSEQQSG